MSYSVVWFKRDLRVVDQQLKKMDAGKIEALQAQATSLRGRLDQL